MADLLSHGIARRPFLASIGPKDEAVTSTFRLGQSSWELALEFLGLSDGIAVASDGGEASPQSPAKTTSEEALDRELQSIAAVSRCCLACQSNHD